MWALNPMTGILVRGEETHTHREGGHLKTEQRWEGCVYQRTPKIAWSYQERGPGTDFPSRLSEGTCTANTFILDLRPLSCEKSISAVLSPSSLWSLVTVTMGTKNTGLCSRTLASAGPVEPLGWAGVECFGSTMTLMQ